MCDTYANERFDLHAIPYRLQIDGTVAVSGSFAESLMLEQGDGSVLKLPWQGHVMRELKGHLTRVYLQEYRNPGAEQNLIVGFVCSSPTHSGGQITSSVMKAATSAAPEALWHQVSAQAWCSKLWPVHVQSLEGITGACVRRNEGWWTYEVCIGRSVRQFHAAAGTAAPAVDFSLGSFQGKSGTVADTARGRSYAIGHVAGGSGPRVSFTSVSAGLPEAPALVQLYGDGTPCDETGRPRESEVRFVCQGDEALLLRSVKEVATCRYVVTVAAAAACSHPELGDKGNLNSGPQLDQVHCMPEPRPETWL